MSADAIATLRDEMHTAITYVAVFSRDDALTWLDAMTRRENRLRRRLLHDAGRLGLSNDGEIIAAIERAVEV